jgi:hypothetical protein
MKTQQETTPKFKNIYQKLLVIQQRIVGLGKDKSAFNYKYVTGDKVLGEIKPLMNEMGLILKQEVLSIENTRQDYSLVDKAGNVRNKSEILSKVMMRFTWVDSETGEKDENLFGANGQNDWDKGCGSAYTYAERYFLLKYFHIATDEDDIDNSERKDETKGVPAQAPKPVQVKEDSEAQRVANMQKKSEPELVSTIAEHNARINKIDTATGLAGYFNSLSSTEKTNTKIIALLSARREAIKVKPTA